jgi:hypothetical protein
MTSTWDQNTIVVRAYQKASSCVVQESRRGRQTVSNASWPSCHRGIAKMSDSANYVKIVAWSEADKCSSAPVPASLGHVGTVTTK